MQVPNPDPFVLHTKEMDTVHIFSYFVLQVLVLSHDPEGPAGTNGVDPGHFARWKDLYLCFQCECRPCTLLR